MKIGAVKALRSTMIASATFGAFASPALAQSTQVRAEDPGEIIVTARKREETSLSVPIAIVAVSGADLERRGINDLNALTQVVPGLQIGSAGSSIQGGTIVLRGISGSDGNPIVDQPVSFNIDGAQVARSSIQRMSEMDIAAVEVLKGPQTLFYGKNSPGGVISIRTADPGDRFEAMLRGGYEFNAREWRGEGFVSGPLTETLGARLAFFGSTMNGWIKNTVPESSIFSDTSNRLPQQDEVAGRLTLKFDPSDVFSARLKVAYHHMKGEGPEPSSQFVYCPYGSPQLGDVTECVANDKGYKPSIGQTFTAVSPAFRDGIPYVGHDQWLASLELNYDISDTLKLTSLSSLYDLSYENMDNFSWTITPTALLNSANTLSIREISQELRLTSSFKGPLNFMIGGHYQDLRTSNTTLTYFDTTAPKKINNYNIKQKGKAYSFFGQLIFDITDQLELSGGGRYSHEEKSIVIRDTGNVVNIPVDSGSWNNFSPDISLAFRPNQNLTFFGSYKQGFLSGGFNGGGGSLTAKRSYDQQKVKGFEAGIKARLLDGKLRTNLSLYNYKITGLQVTTLRVNGNQIDQIVENAGRSRSKGIEFDANYQTPVQGLSLHGGLAYTHARYADFNIGCHPGQTPQLGCTIETAPGVFTRQDLAGEQIIRTPDWTGNVGFVFETPVAAGLNIGFSGDAAYSSSFDTMPEGAPGSRMESYWLVDSSLRVFPDDRAWEIALIGKNLTNEWYWTRSVSRPFSGTAAGSAGTPVLPDIIGGVSRGRQIMLQATVRFGN